MKKLVAVALVLMMAGSALAQFSGLPIAGGAAAPAAKTGGASAGVVLGDDFNLYGGRLSFAPVNGLSLFGDLGSVDPDGGEAGVALQGGALFTLPVDLAVDLGLRGSAGWSQFKILGADADAWGLNAGVVISKTIETLTPYAFIGVDYVDTTVEIGHTDVSDDNTEFDLTGGLSLAVSEQVSLYGEIAWIDDVFFGAGARFNF